MLHIFLCEDNQQQRLQYKDIIDKIVLMEDLDLKLSCVTSDPHELLMALGEKTQTGIYFLDIDLSCDINGLSLAQQIRKKDPRGFIVFITTHSEMAYMTFTYKVEAMDFIIKDTSENIQNRIHQCIVNAYHKYTSPQNVSQKNFVCKIGDRENCTPLKNIVFFETSENARKIILHETDKTIEFAGKIKDIEEEVDDRFYRIHRSFLINKDHIKEIDKKNRIITMSNGEICFASLKQLKGLK